MDHPYSMWADLLSKFQGSPPWIQALSLVLVAAVTFGAIWCLTDFAKHLVAASRRREPKGRIYGLVPEETGRWLVCLEPIAVEDSGDAPKAIAASREDRSPTTMLPPQT